MLNFIKTILETSKERLKNPFLGTLILSWIAVNWKPVTILFFSKATISENIDIIEQNYSDLPHNIWIPLFIALSYVLLLPYLMWLLDLLIKKANDGRRLLIKNELVQDVKGRQDIALEELKLKEIQSNYLEKQDLNKKIKSLEGTIRLLEDDISQKDDEIDSFKETLSNISGGIVEPFSSEEIMNFDKKYLEFKESDIFDNFHLLGAEVSRRKNIPENFPDLIKEKFIHNDIIALHFEENDSYYDFTRRGLYFWKKFVVEIPLKEN